jgi:hypothetical protein
MIQMILGVMAIFDAFIVYGVCHLVGWQVSFVPCLAVVALAYFIAQAVALIRQKRNEANEIN